MHEPNLSVIILEKVAVHLKDLFIVQLLKIVADFQDLAQAKLFWTLLLQLILDSFSNFTFGQIYAFRLALLEDLYSVLIAYLLISIGQPQCLSVQKLVLFVQLQATKNQIIRALNVVQLVPLLLVVIQLHGELDWNVFSEAGMRLDASLHAVKSSPLQAVLTLVHRLLKLLKCQHFVGLVHLSKHLKIVILPVRLVSLDKLTLRGGRVYLTNCIQCYKFIVSSSGLCFP